jgi:serine/threonine-protein kinase HipA
MTDRIEVHVAIGADTVRAGTAFFQRRRQALTTTFTYDQAWLADLRSFALDPGLPLTAGAHASDGLPGSFGDCAPDRWGRNLIAKRARAEARKQQGTPPSLSEIDFLLGVSDHTRQGALRFRTEGSELFSAPDHDIPKLIELPMLLRAAEAVARDSGDDYEAVKALLDAGTGSLGGARPKATVRSDDGHLMIAKFPHHQDDWDVGAWEKTALDLAARAGIEVPERSLAPLGPGSTVLLSRFDRTAGGARIPYISALSLVSGNDGGAFDYEDLAAQIEEAGADAGTDLENLFRRVVLSVAIHNTDDHLRNTGFLHGHGGWRLSPIFDINPNPDLGTGRQTTISGAETVGDEPDGVMHLAQWCHLDAARALRVITEVLDATACWREVAVGNGIGSGEIRRFAEMFDHQAAALRQLVDSAT